MTINIWKPFSESLFNQNLFWNQTRIICCPEKCWFVNANEILYVLHNCFYVSWILPFIIVYPEWGSAGQTYNRFLPNAYQDGTSEPRGGRHPSSLPNPRWVSQRNHPDSDIPDYRFTHMVMQFGQFLDHDITMTPKDGKWWEVAWFCFANVPNKIMCLCRRNKLLFFWSPRIKLFYYTHT